jgi:3-deoxy-D-manno-octulosonate 8-phosphate phosphatase (KDO 8-P phosphatase)
MEIITEKLATFKGLILDGDGVFFTGSETRGVLPSGEVLILKTRSLQDGQGISFLRSIGIKIVFATGEGQPLDSIVAKLNTLPSVTDGTWAPVELFTKLLKRDSKVASIGAWLEKHQLTWDECVYIGDDRTDFEAMQLAGIKVAPANARRIIKSIADIQLQQSGGDGAIREFAEMVLDARKIDETTLPSA